MRLDFLPMATACALPSATPISARLPCGRFRADGKDLHPVLPDWNKPAQESGGTWTPQGDYFLFDSTRDHSQNIWALREGTSLFHKADTEPTQLTIGPLMFSNPTPSPDGKKLFVIGQQRRFDLIRLDHKSQFSIYLPGVSAGEADITSQRRVDHLRGASGTYLVAEQTGWKFPHSTHLCAHAGPYSALVAGWNSDRIYGIASGKALEDFRDASRGRHAARSDCGRSQSGRSHMDAQRRFHRVCGNAMAGVWDRDRSQHSYR